MSWQFDLGGLALVAGSRCLTQSHSGDMIWPQALTLFDIGARDEELLSKVWNDVPKWPGEHKHVLMPSWTTILRTCGHCRPHFCLDYWKWWISSCSMDIGMVPRRINVSSQSRSYISILSYYIISCFIILYYYSILSYYMIWYDMILYSVIISYHAISYCSIIMH